MESCCQKNNNRKKGFWSGILYGLIPHTFCIAFFVLSLIGAVGSAAIVKKFLLIPHFFLLLTIISFFFATLAAFFYLKRNNCCNIKGIKGRKKYLLTLYATTIITNILVAYIIIPAYVNRRAKPTENNEEQLSITNIDVQIPCPGHAPLIISEVEKVAGVKTITFKSPDKFEITYDPKTTSLENIATLDIFKTFKLKYN
jgi:hypothetical protein